jgi:hypothetical protein
MSFGTASRLLEGSHCDYVFTSPKYPTKPLLPFLTGAGEYTDPFTLQYVAGDDNIKTTTRPVHPREVAVHKLFA